MKNPLKHLSLNQHHKVSNYLCGTGLASYLIATLGESIFFLVTALVLISGGLIYALIFIRCPYCGTHLHWYMRFGKLPNHCAHCAKRIDYNTTEE